MLTHQDGYQQSESKRHKSTDPADIAWYRQKTLMKRLGKEEKENIAAAKQQPAFDLYRDVGRAPAQVPGSISGPRMPGYEWTGRGYGPKRSNEGFVPVTRAQAIKTLLGEMLNSASSNNIDVDSSNGVEV